MISQTAMRMIESALIPIVRSGKQIDRINLMVSQFSVIAKLNHIETKFGSVKIVPGDCIPKGYSYLIEEPLSKGGLSFAWVSKRS